MPNQVVVMFGGDTIVWHPHLKRGSKDHITHGPTCNGVVDRFSNGDGKHDVLGCRKCHEFKLVVTCEVRTEAQFRAHFHELNNTRAQRNLELARAFIRGRPARMSQSRVL